MRGQDGFFEVEERLNELLVKGDDLARLNAIVDFKAFRLDLKGAEEPLVVGALDRGDLAIVRRRRDALPSILLGARIVVRESAVAA